MGETDRTAAVVAYHIDLLESLVGKAGYRVIGAADTAFNGEHIVAHHQPDVIVLENELKGAQGWESTRYFREVSPGSKIVLVAADGWTPSEVGAIGAFAVVSLGRVAELVEILIDLDTWMTRHAANGTAASDRRLGRERRLIHDWSKVGWEKRLGQRRKVLVGV